MKKGIYINDTIHGLIPLSEYEKRIISSIGFNRLHDVYQNSTVYLTFPTNRTKRFEHSIGTMKICSDMFFYSVLNASNTSREKFYMLFEREINFILREIAKDTGLCEQKLGGITPREVPKLSLSNLRYSLIPRNVPEKYEIIHLIIIQAIRAGALLHDIGHPPFSHIVEGALESVYEEKKSCINNSIKEKKYVEVMSNYFGNEKMLHEEMGDEISDSILKSIIINIQDEDERFVENLFEIFVMICVRKIFKNEGLFSCLHKIIDDSLDGDRLDYVSRDSVNSGMNDGVIDYKRIINDMRLVVDKEEIYFCVPLKTRNSVEDFIKRRYNIYKQIIFHHRVIKTDFLLEYTVKDLIIKYLDEKKDSEADGEVVIPFDISGLWFPLGDATVVEKANALSQWNDSWLMTVLKQIYYRDYYRKSIRPTDSDYVLSQRLSELLRNTKCYYSIVKRSENFKVIDDEVKRILNSSKERLRNLLELTNAQPKSVECIIPPEGAMVDMNGTIKFMGSLLQCVDQDKNGFILSLLHRNYKAIQIKSEEEFQNFIKTIVEQSADEIFVNTKCYDTITVFKRISSGLSKPIYFYDEIEKIYTFDEISGVAGALTHDADRLPVFYIYILIKDGKNIVKERQEAFLRSIGEKIGKNIVEIMMSILKEKSEQMEGMYV